MTKTWNLSSVDQAVMLATTFTQSWFRGHSREVNELSPRLYRRQYYDQIQDKIRPHLELSNIEYFKRNAPVLSDCELPEHNDHLGWLCIMQHYKVPTRMLDWTENALLAIYFAVAEDMEEDGEIWVMFPQKLNAFSICQEGVPIEGASPALNFFSEQPYFNGTSEQLAKEVGLNKPPKGPIAFLPKRIFPRMLAQASAFTIHMQPGSGECIPSILKDHKHLFRLFVPKSAKEQMRKDLNALGINTRALFPELDSLAQEIVEDMKILGYGAPDPSSVFGESL